MRTHLHVAVGFFLFSCLIPTAAAQDVTFEVRPSTTTVRVGEPFEVRFESNKKGRFLPPEFRGFQVLAGPNTSYHMEIINGRMRARHSIGYVLRAMRPGSYTIDPGTLIVGGKQYRTRPVTIKVQPSGSSSAPPPASSDRTAAETAADSLAPVFIKAVVNRWSPYEGQAVGISYYLYTRLNIQDYAVRKVPTFSDFYAYPIEIRRPVPHETVINGQPYQYVKIYEAVVFPLRSGRLTIPPLEMEAVALIPQRVIQRMRSPFEDFFADDPFFRQFFEDFNTGWEGYTYQPKLLKLKSRPLQLKVKALPVAGKPFDFSGLVGRFTMESTIDSTTISKGGTATITLRISGEGNIQMIDIPEPDLPPGLSSYPSETEEKFTARDGTVRGYRQFRFYIEGLQPGRYAIPPFHFSYFDPDKKEYVRLSTDTFTLVVRGTEQVDSTHRAPTLPPKDIAFLRPSSKRWYRMEALWLPQNWGVRYGSAWGGALGLMLILWWLRRRKERHGGIFIGAEKRTFRQLVREAETALQRGDARKWGQTVTRGFEWLFQHRLALPPAALNVDSLRQALSAHMNADEEAAAIAKAWETAQAESIRPFLSEEQRRQLWRQIRKQWQRLLRLDNPQKQPA